MKINIMLNKLKSYVYSSHFTINLLGSDISHPCPVAIYSGYLQ